MLWNLQYRAHMQSNQRYDSIWRSNYSCRNRTSCTTNPPFACYLHVYFWSNDNIQLDRHPHDPRYFVQLRFDTAANSAVTMDEKGAISARHCANHLRQIQINIDVEHPWFVDHFHKVFHNCVSLPRVIIYFERFSSCIKGVETTWGPGLPLSRHNESIENIIHECNWNRYLKPPAKQRDFKQQKSSFKQQIGHATNIPAKPCFWH